jgi:predicted dehydrogenase
LVDYCRKIGLKNIYGDWRLMLQREQLDAIALAVIPRAQEEIAEAAIMRGLHVFAEKPLALSVPKAKKLLALATKKRVVHGMDFLFPEIAAWRKAKEFIDRETLGPLKHVAVNWDFLSYDIRHGKATWKTDAREGGGALSFYFSHGLHYLEHFAGKCSSVRSPFTYADESLNGAEVGVDMLLRFTSGCSGTAHVCCNSRGPQRHRLVFHCEQGVIVLENEDRVVDGFRLETYDRRGKKQWKVKEDRDRKGEDERVKIVRKLATRFVDCCINHTQMSPSFREGVRVQELIEKVRVHALA